MKRNANIRELAKSKGVFLYEIAESVNVTEFTIIRWLRDEPMKEEHKKMIISAINDISKRKANKE